MAYDIRHYNRKQIWLAEMMEFLGLIPNADEFFKDYSDKYRKVYTEQNGVVTIDDILKK